MEAEEIMLEEAIAHCEEVAKKNEDFVKTHKNLRELDFVKRCVACAADHRQLAKWLRELQERRKQPEIIRCKDCKWYKVGFSWNGKKYPLCAKEVMTTSGNNFCSKAERRTDD